MASKCLIFALCLFYIAGDLEAQDVVAMSEKQFTDDVVVADAVFRGVYVGIVRLIQRISDDDDGAPSTAVMVKLKYKANDSVTINHMWHVEHDPITGVDCAANNIHFAPFGITKQTNYTTYCSSISPDYCEIGDTSGKTTLTSVGKGVVEWYDVPMLPLVGPWTVIGHSVNVHGGAMSKQRQGCGNVLLNKRMTPARVVDIQVKIPDSLQPEHVADARMKIARQLKIPISKVQTALRFDSLASGCVNMTFLIFGRGAYAESKLQELRDGKVDIGKLSPVSCTVSNKTVRSSDSVKETCDEDTQNEKKYGKSTWNDDTDDGDEVVADAVFRGVYEGVVRMIQKVTSATSGYPKTTVIVRVKYANSSNTTEKHMWHVEHDPISTVDCAASNKHYAPYGITKEANYTIYCSDLTPDYCELGDISSKSTLTRIGKDVVERFSIPLLPIVGPRTMIGHSVNIHAGNMSKERRACGNIELNTRMTRAKIVNMPIKKPAVLLDEDLITTRVMMSEALGIPLSKVHTAVRLDTVPEGCTRMQFLIFDRGNYCPDALKKLEDGETDIGPLTPKGCTFNRGATTKPPTNGAKGIAVYTTLILAIALIFIN